MKRREFITLLGGAAAAPSLLWPLAARAQQQVPVIGMLNPATAEGYAEVLRRFREGLKEAGYVEGENVAFEYRWAGNDVSRLPELAADLVRRRVALIAATGGPAPALAAKAATSTIPILFTVGGDPVRLGLVASLGRPGGNLTGTNFFIFELGAKRLEVLRELLPGMARLAVLVDPSNAEITAANLKEVEPAARAMGLQMRVLEARNNREIDAAFATLEHERPDALFISSGPLFTSRRVQLVLLATRLGIPTAYPDPEHVRAGGLISYGASRGEAYRQVGLYAGRILKGASPADLPVMQSTKFELCINLQAARLLGLEVPATLLARADEVIE
jgi:putative ABC transport system substrate-binding protein